MTDRRLIINLLFFFFGILIPMLASQSAFAGCEYGGFRKVFLEIGEYSQAPVDEWLAEKQALYGGRTCSALLDDGSCASSYGFKFFNWGFNGHTYTGSMYSYYCVTNDDPPPSTEPETCNNSVKDDDESGVDCGGSCTPCSISPDDQPRDCRLNVSTSPSK